jgi:hypothetical protein
VKAECGVAAVGVFVLSARRRRAFLTVCDFPVFALWGQQTREFRLDNVAFHWYLNEEVTLAA